MKGNDKMDCVSVFYNKFEKRIAKITTSRQRNNILSDMAEYFERHVRSEPENRNALSRAYQQLKLRCWEVG